MKFVTLIKCIIFLLADINYSRHHILLDIQAGRVGGDQLLCNFWKLSDSRQNTRTFSTSSLLETRWNKLGKNACKIYRFYDKNIYLKLPLWLCYKHRTNLTFFQATNL